MIFILPVIGVDSSRSSPDRQVASEDAGAEGSRIDM
jgi:hypothetical protein